MVERIKNLNAVGKIYLTIDITIFIAFVLFPFVTVVGVVGGTALKTPFQLINLYRNGMNLLASLSSSGTDRCFK